jgi:purine nucleoside phosphorylase
MVRVMRRAGVELYVTTNSSGGCQPGMKQGCIMAIRDHMNWFHRNPLLEGETFLFRLMFRSHCLFFFFLLLVKQCRSCRSGTWT